MKKFYYLSVVLLPLLWAALILPSCSGPERPQRSDDENVGYYFTEKVILLDHRLERHIKLQAIKAERLENNLLRVRALLYNDTNETLTVQIKARFKDKDGFVVEETNWQPVVLVRREMTQYEENSLNDQAEDYILMIKYYRSMEKDDLKYPSGQE